MHQPITLCSLTQSTTQWNDCRLINTIMFPLGEVYNVVCRQLNNFIHLYGCQIANQWIQIRNVSNTETARQYCARINARWYVIHYGPFVNAMYRTQHNFGADIPTQSCLLQPVTSRWHTAATIWLCYSADWRSNRDRGTMNFIPFSEWLIYQALSNISMLLVLLFKTTTKINNDNTLYV